MDAWSGRSALLPTILTTERCGLRGRDAEGRAFPAARETWNDPRYGLFHAEGASGPTARDQTGNPMRRSAATSLTPASMTSPRLPRRDERRRQQFPEYPVVIIGRGSDDQQVTRPTLLDGNMQHPVVTRLGNYCDSGPAAQTGRIDGLRLPIRRPLREPWRRRDFPASEACPPGPWGRS